MNKRVIVDFNLYLQADFSLYGFAKAACLQRSETTGYWEPIPDTEISIPCIATENKPFQCRYTLEDTEFFIDIEDAIDKIDAIFDEHLTNGTVPLQVTRYADDPSKRRVDSEWRTADQVWVECKQADAKVLKLRPTYYQRSTEHPDITQAAIRFYAQYAQNTPLKGRIRPAKKGRIRPAK